MSIDKDKKIKRREFLAYGSTLGLCGLGAAVSSVAIYKYLMPVVSYGTPKKFKISTRDIPDVGEEIIFSDQKVILRRSLDKKIAAVSLVCTHLGCTVNRVTTGFQCPCHGSQYDEDGIVVGGPSGLPSQHRRRIPCGPRSPVRREPRGRPPW